MHTQVLLLAASFLTTIFAQTTCPPPTPVNGSWSAWSAWSPYDQLSGCGEQTRCRECNNPAPAFDGAPCVGPVCQSRNDQSGTSAPAGCPLAGAKAVDGAWSAWSPWSTCSVTVGQGLRYRTRVCNDPPPSNGGQGCCHADDPNSVDIQPCTVIPPPVDGSWGAWGTWSSCSTTCGEGEQTRTRPCNNPSPLFCGKDCVGSSSETQLCNENVLCPENGRGRCEYDGALGLPHLFNFRRGRTNIMIPCQYHLLSLFVRLTSVNINVNCYNAHWHTPIQGRYFVWSVECQLEYLTTTNTSLGFEVFQSSTPFFNSPSASLGWNKLSNLTSGVTSVSSVQGPNNKNTTVLSISNAVTIEYTPIEPNSPAIRAGAKPGIFVEVDRNKVSGNAAFPNTHCSKLTGDITLTQYSQQTSVTRDALGLWAVLEQNGVQTMPGVDSQCSAVLQQYQSCPSNKKAAAVNACYKLTDDHERVVCLTDNRNVSAFGAFSTCLSFMCNDDLAACQTLRDYASTCTSVANNPLDLSSCSS